MIYIKFLCLIFKFSFVFQQLQKFSCNCLYRIIVFSNIEKFKEFILILSNFVLGQDIPVNPTTVGIGTYYGLTAPLKDLPVITQEEFREMMLEEFVPNEEERKEKLFPFAKTALPKGDDPV